MTEQGFFKLVQGVPSEIPQFPKSIEKAMLIAQIESPAYVLDVNDIVYLKSRNRRYTMKDIGVLERRIGRIEYYTALNLLERDAESFQIQDANGLDRFKAAFPPPKFIPHKLFFNVIASASRKTSVFCSLKLL